MDYAALERRQEEEDVVEFEYGGVLLTIRLRDIAKALSRVGEVVYATRSTAQELSAAYGDAMSEIRQVCNRAESALSAARDETEKVRGEIILDFVSGELERRGLKDSEDRRKAVWSTHPRYLDALEKRRYLQWVVGDLERKHRRLYDANRTALAILGDRDYHRGGLSGGSAQTQAGPAPKYGQARY